MENFTTESSYLKPCFEFRTAIRFIKAVFYRLDYQNFLMCSLMKRLAKHLFQKIRPSLWNSRPSFWNTRPSFWGFKRKVNAPPRVWNARSSVWKARPRVCVVTRPMMSQSATVSDIVEERILYALFRILAWNFTSKI